MTAPQRSDCNCLQTRPGETSESRELGWDAHYADIETFRCARCGQPWLRYRYENESFSRSAQVYLGAISEADFARVDAAEAKALLERIPQYFCGGPGVGGSWFESSGPLNLFP